MKVIIVKVIIVMTTIIFRIIPESHVITCTARTTS